jgi:hypothetical protein
MCGRSTGAYTNLGDLQRDLMGVKSHPTKKIKDGDRTFARNVGEHIQVNLDI